MGDPGKIYDISSKQQEVIRWKDARRRQLRMDYLQKTQNPNFEGEPFDPAIQRFLTIRQCHDHIFRPNIKNFLWYCGVVFLPMGLTYYLLKSRRDAKEHLYRTGQISYKDRDFKFT